MTETITHLDWQPILPDCCQIGFAAIDSYQGSEKAKLIEKLPAIQTVVVIAHHVQDSLEWTWLKFQAARTGETCPADLHCLAVAERVTGQLEANGHRSVILPYPGVCGLIFKTLALPTGIGQLGDNFLLMNADWGPWIHLRVVLTDAVIRHDRKKPEAACNHCGRCIQACPGEVFKAGTFDGLACREAMRKMSKMHSDGSFCFECELCLRACPVGKQPKGVQVRFKD
jgi:NAD-dependent dihydropyrimidine dehydrogenase PreA subunit